MNKKLAIAFGVLTWVMLAVIVANQVRLQLMLQNRDANAPPAPQNPALDIDTMRRTIAEFERAQREAAIMAKRAADAARQIELLEARLQQLQTRLPSGRYPRPLMVPPDIEPPGLPEAPRGRGWGPEQVTGPPDTMLAGDISTAWASRNPDDGPEWLKVDYERETQVAEVRVRETYNPGAVVRVTAVLPGGQEALLWEGDESPAQAPVDRSFPATQANVTAKSIKIYLDTKKVPGWNEIDAVELIGTDGSRQWASQATASSSYADPR